MNRQSRFDKMITLPSGREVREAWLRRVTQGFADYDDLRIILQMELRDVKYIIAEWLTVEEF